VPDLQQGKHDTFVDAMCESLLRITRAFSPRPVVYRSIDFDRTSSVAWKAVNSSNHTKKTR